LANYYHIIMFIYRRSCCGYVGNSQRVVQVNVDPVGRS